MSSRGTFGNKGVQRTGRTKRTPRQIQSMKVARSVHNSSARYEPFNKHNAKNAGIAVSELERRHIESLTAPVQEGKDA